MQEVRDLNRKLVGTLNKNHTVFTSKRRGCITTITVNPDGTLRVTLSKPTEKIA